MPPTHSRVDRFAQKLVIAGAYVEGFWTVAANVFIISLAVYGVAQYEPRKGKDGNEKDGDPEDNF